MKTAATKGWIVFLTLGFIASMLPSRASGQASAGAEVLTNDSIVQMVVGKVPKNLILAKIQSTKNTFDITAHELVSLYQKKVATDTIKVMIQAVPPSAPKELLTNDAVVYMVTNQLPREIIISKIQSSKPGFDLTSTGLVGLNQNKVSQDVMKAMMTATSGPAPPTTPAAASTPSRKPAQAPATPPKK